MFFVLLRRTMHSVRFSSQTSVKKANRYILGVRGTQSNQYRNHHHHHHHHHHHSLNCEGRWGTTDNFATSFLHFSLVSTALWDLANSRPVHSLMLSSHLFFCQPVFFPLSLCPARWFWPDLTSGRHAHTTSVCVCLQLSLIHISEPTRHDHITAVCIFLRWSGGLCVVRLPAGS